MKERASAPTATEVSTSAHAVDQQWQLLADRPFQKNQAAEGGAYSPTIRSSDLEGDHFQTQLLTTSGKLAGQITYSVKGSVLKVDLIQVNPSFQGKGLGAALYAKMLADNPSAKRITALLELSNKDAFEKAISEGKSTEDAMKSTPSYAICAKLGFKRIVWKGLRERDGSKVLKTGGLLNIVLTVER